ncbi:TPA: ParB/RepB/Spo0J family partition protein, partial [Escherichia coli]
EDRITTEHCQALALENDTERQVQVFEAACQSGWGGKPEVQTIRRLVTESEVAVAGNSKFRFVGADAFSPDELRTDLFSDDEGGYVDCVALDAALLEKLQAVAEHLREAEGWEWCAGRMEPVGFCSEDAGTYRSLPEPEAVLTEAEEERLNELMARYDALENQCEESDLLEAEMKLIDCMAKVRAWTPEMRAGSGVVVSWRYGNVCVQRGVQLRSEDDVADDADHTEQVQEKASVEEISLPLLTKMSSERTLAVQAALMQQPDKSLALLAWTLCLNVFGSGAYSNPARIRLECEHYSLTSDAPSGKEGAAFMALMAEKARLAALLPEGWARDMTTFLSLSQEVLLSLLSFCTACSIHGVQTREYGHTSRSPLDSLESAIGFHMRDWWQPTKANFFGHLKKPQIIAALNEAGLSGAARDAEKMKKGDAAEHAEHHMKDNRWVPGWMCAPRPQTDATERTDNLADAA